MDWLLTGFEPVKPTLTAVLLTGGESRRMGWDKAMLIYEGRPLWQRQLDLLRALRPESILISARVKPAWCPPDVTVALDAPPSSGPLSGLVAALNQVRTTHLLVLAVDLPQMTAGHLQTLWAAIPLGKGIIPQHDDYFEPLCAIYPVEVRDLAVQALATGQFSLQSLTGTLIGKKLVQPRLLRADEWPLYHNTNRPEDLNPMR